MFSQKSSIQTRLIVGFSSVLMLMAILTGIGISQVQKIDASLKIVNDSNSVKQRYAINFRGSVHDRAISLRDVVLINDPSGYAQALADIEKLSADYAKSAGPLDTIFAAGGNITPTEVEILAEIKAIEAKTMPLIKQVIDLKNAGDMAGAQSVLLNQASPQFTGWLKAINKLIDFEEAANKKIGAEVTKVAGNFALLMLSICGIALAIGAGFAWWNIRSVRPLRDLKEAMLKVAAGEFHTELPKIISQDEVGDMIGAVEILKTRAIANTTLRESAKDVESATAAEMIKQRHLIADEFQTKMGAITNAVVLAANDVAQSAENLFSTAEEASRQTRSVSGAAEEAASNVHSVATATEQIAASVQDISGQAMRAADVAQAAATEALDTESDVRTLSEMAQSIGVVVSLIDDIASQTNLLALNATIEAARAGDAGKGFAVVASEVKTLATQTASATKEIGDKIAGIQNATHRSVESIGRIVATINDLRNISASISTSVEQQGSAAHEIARNTARASDGTQKMKDNLESVTKSTVQTGAASTQLMTLSNNLSSQASDMQREVIGFVAQLRAG